jgi:Fe-S cluster biogenesis protein NfuA
MAFEVRFLKMEGRVVCSSCPVVGIFWSFIVSSLQDEAYELEQVMRRMQVNKMKKRMQNIREAGLLAGRKIMDG